MDNGHSLSLVTDMISVERSIWGASRHCATMLERHVYREGTCVQTCCDFDP